MRWALLLLLSSCIAESGEPLTPRPKPQDYPVQSEFAKAVLGAEFHAHTVPFGGTPFFTSEYLVIEVGVFPGKGQPVTVGPGDFTLRLNGKKIAILAHSPGMVVASIKNTGWNQTKQVVVTGGVGDAEVIVGGPQRQPRFPGDRTGTPQQRPRAPEPDNTGGVVLEQQPEPAEIIPDKALTERTLDHSVGGYLYFPYSGKLKALKTIELLYTGSAGEGKLELR